MLDLFGYNKTDRELSLAQVAQISGLGLLFDFISNEEEKELLNAIDSNPWLSDLKRRVQHYGYKYDYRARRLDTSFYLGDLPYWMTFLVDRLLERQLILFRPDQAIINEYVDGQGIAPHIDCEPCFGDTIISISLSGQCVMNFQKGVTVKEQEKTSLLIPPKTLLLMTGESRFDWFHGIPSRKTDKFNNQLFTRQRRVSITFRKVILNATSDK